MVPRTVRNQTDPATLLAERRKNPSYVTATDLLSNPKLNLTARGRRKLKKKRIVRYVSTETPKSQADRVYERVTRLSMGGLVRLIEKTERRIKTATHILDDLPSDSLLRPGVEAQRKAEKNTLIAATYEYGQRQNSEPVKDATNPQHKRRAALIAMVAGGGQVMGGAK
jgi:tRNA/tmRNA/rRNA uracil-C5-methylase (TrmA/RlmC/RlmD family)